MNHERLAELEDERSFLLGSIRDLEREHDAGDVDEHDFTTLRDGYVARAAAVLREIDDGRSSRVATPSRPWWRRIAVVAATLLVAGALGVFVAHSAGQRLPGQSLTGGQPLDEVATQLALARQNMGSDPQASLKAYARVLELEPDNAEAYTYSAWLGILAGRQVGDPSLIEAALPTLRKAIELDPQYADPHCFLAVASGRFLDPPQREVAVTEGKRCIELHAPAALAGSIQQLIDEMSVPAPDDTTVST